MEDKVNKVIDMAGSCHKFQFILLIGAFFTWMHMECILISLSFLTLGPTIANFSEEDLAYSPALLEYSQCDQEYSIISFRNHSWTVYFNIYCDPQKVGFIGSCTFIGYCLATLMIKSVVDSLGRKKTILVYGLFYCITAGLFPFVNTLEVLYIFTGLLIFFGSTASMSSFIFLTENLKADLRPGAAAVSCFAFSVSALAYILTYKLLDDWKTSLSINAALSFLTLIYYVLLAVESPQFYLIKKDWRKFASSLRQVAKINGMRDSFDKSVNYPDCFYRIEDHESGTNVDFEEEISHTKSIFRSQSQILVEKIATSTGVFKEIKNLQRLEEENKLGAFALIQYPSVRYTFLIMCAQWFIASGLYFGIGIYLKNLKGDIYLMGIALYAVEFIPYLYIGLAGKFNLMGRKTMFIMFSIVLTAVYLLIYFFFAGTETEAMLSLIGKMAIAGVFNLDFVISSEIYPTTVKSLGFGLNNFSARLAGIVFPMIVEVLKDQVTLIFLGISCVTLILSLFVEETAGKEMKTEIREIKEAREKGKNVA